MLYILQTIKQTIDGFASHRLKRQRINVFHVWSAVRARLVGPPTLLHPSRVAMTTDKHMESVDGSAGDAGSLRRSAY